MHDTAVISVVGLASRFVGEHTPNLLRLQQEGAVSRIREITPAVTCSAQSTYLTGLLPSGHGIVANGWYFRDVAEVAFWKQSDHLVQGEKVWETARKRDLEFRCAKMFWWYNMYSSVDYSVTPRPIYRADGKKIFDIYGAPSSLPERLKAELGDFPFTTFWGPMAGIDCSRWIAEASMKTYQWHQPTLTLIYLPHLDYDLQRYGPDDPSIGKQLQAIDEVCGRLIDFFLERDVRVMILSEYGITSVQGPIHINRILRKEGWIQVRNEKGPEALDAGASQAFAVSDHQIAHIYVRDYARIPQVREVLEAVEGIERVLDGAGKSEFGLDHPRSGELVAISQSDRWFTYYYWLDDAVAPDFARTVDIHRKPGYDPAELFIDPKISLPRLKGAWILLKKALGFRYLMDLIPLDAGLVKGSHGRVVDDPADNPLLITNQPQLLEGESISATQVRDLILDHIFK